jgi:hypothetical protein
MQEILPSGIWTIQCTAIMYMMDSDPIKSYALTCKMPRWVNYSDFHTTSEDHVAWIINLQIGCQRRS